MKKIQTLVIITGFAAYSLNLSAASLVTITDVFGHNEESNFTGTIQDTFNGSGMNGNLADGDPNWYTTNASHPSTWTLTPSGNFSGPQPLYGAEWQSKDLLDGEAGDDAATNAKIGWIVFDLGGSVDNLDEFYVWHIRENSSRWVTEFNIYTGDNSVAAFPSPANGVSKNYDFLGTGWSFVSNETGAIGSVAPSQSGLQVFDLSGASANYVAIEIIANNGDATRAGFQEIGITAVPEPSAFALLSGFCGLTWVMLRRRRA